MTLVKDLPFVVFSLGFGCYWLLSALWPDRFARGYFGEELRRAKHAEDRRAIRTVWCIGSSGLFLVGATMIARAIVPGFPDYLFFGIALVIICIPVITTYFR